MTPVKTAWSLVADLGGLDLDELRHHHIELVSATAELARSAGLDWPWGSDDPTVAVVRALAKLAFIAPEATSERATELCEKLIDDQLRGSGPGRASHRFAANGTRSSVSGAGK